MKAVHELSNRGIKTKEQFLYKIALTNGQLELFELWIRFVSESEYKKGFDDGGYNKIHNIKELLKTELDI